MRYDPMTTAQRPEVGEMLTPVLAHALAAILDVRFPAVTREMLANDPRLMTEREVRVLKALGVVTCGWCGGPIAETDPVFPIDGRLLHNGGGDRPDCRDEHDRFTESPFGVES